MGKIVERTYSARISDPRLLDLAREAAEVYNTAQEKFWEVESERGVELDKYRLQAELKGLIHVEMLGGDSRLAAMQQFSRAFSNHKAAMRSYAKDPERFNGVPNPPTRPRQTCSVFFKKENIRIRNGMLLLSLAKGFDPIKTRWNPDTGTPKFAIINWNTRRGWELHCVVEKQVKEEKLNPGRSMGIDLGVKRIAATCDDDGVVVTYSGKKIKSLVRLREKLKADVASRSSGMIKHSRRYKRLRRGLRKQVRRIDNQIKDVLHKASRTMVNYCVRKNIGMAVVGDCSGIHDSPNMGRRNNQAISQGPEQRLRKYFQYKMEDIGGRVVTVPEPYSSKTCPKCGARSKPKNRLFRCKKCGFEYDRDGVGALNIWGLGRKVSLGGALSALGRSGGLTPPIGWKYKSSRDCLVPVGPGLG